MSGRLEVPVSCGVTNNLPYATVDFSLTTHVKWTDKPTQGLIRIEESGQVPFTHRIVATDIDALGVAVGHKPAGPDQVARDLVAATNLAADRGVVSRWPPMVSGSSLTPPPAEEQPPRVEVRGGVTTVQVNATIGVRAQASASLTTQDTFDEARVADAYRRVVAVRARETGAGNARKALDAFARACDTHGAEGRLSALWMAVEQAMGALQVGLSGSSLDAAVARRTGTTADQVERIRKIANRIKHADPKAGHGDAALLAEYRTNPGADLPTAFAIVRSLLLQAAP